MATIQSPRSRLFAALAALVLVAALGASQGLSAAGAARLLLAVLALGGLGLWFWKHRQARPTGFKAVPRLTVVARSGLSQRAGVALVEVDGQAFLVVHGDGFARVRATRRRAPVEIRRPRATDEVRPLQLRHRRGGS